MAYMPVMEVLDCAQNLFYYFGCLFLRQTSIVHYLLKEFSPFAHLSHKMEEVLVHVYFVEGYDIRMIHLHQNVELSLQQVNVRVNSLSGDTFDSELLPIV